MKGYLVLFLTTMIFVQCGQIQKDHEHEDLNIFKYNESAGISILDPANVTRFEDFIAVRHCYNGLVRLDEEMQLKPDLATSWEVKDSGRIYEFQLREDVLFHNDECFTSDEQRKVTAEDVAFSLLRVSDPSNLTRGNFIFDGLDRSEKSNYKGIEVLSEYRLRIYLKEAQPSFLYQLSLPYGSVIPSEAIDKYGDNISHHPVGTGPFKFKSWQRDSKLIFHKNEEYFEKDEEGNSLPYLDAINVTFIKDKGSEMIQFQKGNLHMLSGFGETQKENLLDENGSLKEELKDQFYLEKKPWLNTDYLGILMDERITSKSDNPLSKKKVRQAIAHSIDLNTLIKYKRSGIGIPANDGFVPSGMPNFDALKIKGYEYDLSKAKSLLSEAGYPEGQGAPEIKLTTTKEYVDICEFVQKSISEIGLKANIEILNSSMYGQHIAQFESTFYRKSWVADFPDPINYLQLFYSKNFYPENGLNYTHFKNEEYDNLYEAALIEDKESQRTAIYHEMLEILNEELPVIPLFYGESVRFYQKNIEGVVTNSMNTMDLKKVRLK